MRVVTIGAHLLDILGRSGAAIGPGDPPAAGDEIKITVGGNAAGVAVDLAILGASVATIGAVGDDAAGDLLLARLGERGVGVEAVTRLPGVPTAAQLISVPAGAHPVLHTAGANAAVRVDQLDLSPLAHARAVHLGGLNAMRGLGDDDVAEIARAAREHDLVISMDVQSGDLDDDAERVLPWLRYVDVFLPTLEQGAALTGCDDPVDVGRALLGSGVTAVVLTMGAEGSLYLSNLQVIHTPAESVDVVDTTGCGDAFCAAFLLGMLYGLETGHALHTATTAAALVAGGLGSDAGLVSWDRLL